MEEQNYFLKYSCPAIVVFLAICLGILNYYRSQQVKLEEDIVKLSIEKDSLKTENRKLRQEIEQIKTNQKQHIRLDVFCSGDGAAVKERMYKQ